MATRKTKLKSGRKTSRVAAGKESAQQSESAPKVRVRMYRQGLGDCFLITFNPGPKEAHMLIDCGTLGSKGGASMKDVVADIRAVTRDHLSLLVATHEHKDHVSGFGDYEEEFKKIKVDHVWMAWTENPEDKTAQALKKHADDLAVTARAAAYALRAVGNGAVAEEIEDVLGFTGFGAGKFARTIDEAMDFVRTGLGGKTRYLDPGTTVEEDWLPGFRFYVLGPPRSEDAIRDTVGHAGENDLYHLAPGLKSGAMKAAGMSEGGDESEMPFDIRFRIGETDPMLASSLKNYRKPAEAWRRVDSDWLHGAADFALQLDSLTNNTSLALAIERISDGKVLLFPADAQHGHWLSWHEAGMRWEVRAAAGSSVVDAKNLLQRTVFYKVGHHGSHNATAREKGLELMTCKDELVAFIPVDREVALDRNPKGSWKMPARELYRALLAKCEGRVVRSDLGWAEDAANAKNKVVEKEFLDVAGKSDWAGWKSQREKANVEIKELYVDFHMD